MSSYGMWLCCIMSCDVVIMLLEMCHYNFTWGVFMLCHWRCICIIMIMSFAMYIHSVIQDVYIMLCHSFNICMCQTWRDSFFALIYQSWCHNYMLSWFVEIHNMLCCVICSLHVRCRWLMIFHTYDKPSLSCRCLLVTHLAHQIEYHSLCRDQ